MQSALPVDSGLSQNTLSLTGSRSVRIALVLTATAFIAAGLPVFTPYSELIKVTSLVAIWSVVSCWQRA